MKSDMKGNDASGSIIFWLKVMGAAFLLALFSLVFVGVLVIQGFNDQRARDKLQDDRQLDARIVESCHNYNRDQTQNRKAEHHNLLSLAELAGRPIDENNLTPEFAIALSVFDQEMADFYKYRKCDLNCAKAALDKDIPDCPPSQNEEGT